MKDIDQIRRENMALLEKEAGGVTAAANRLDWSQPQWSNLQNGARDSKTGKERGMRKETARKIEAAFIKPPGWLDIDNSENFNLITEEKTHAENILKAIHYLSNKNKEDLSSFFQFSIDKISQFARPSAQKPAPESAAHDMMELIKERSNILSILNSESILGIILSYLKKSGNPDMIALAESIEAALHRISAEKSAA